MDENIICRLCLDIVPTGYTILKENIQNTIKVLTSIDVTDDNDLPKLSCSKCIFNLYFIENIRNLIIKSDEKLRTVIDRDGNLNEFFVNKTRIQLDDDNCSNSDDVSYNHVEVKEEKFNPACSTPEVPETTCTLSEECGNSMANLSEGVPDSTSNDDMPARSSDEDVLEKTSNEDIFDIRNIIYKKDNVKPCLYHCNVCNVDFRGKKLYMTHKGKHTKKTCEICGVTTRQDNFNKHMTKHKLGQQICDICGSIHKSLEGLRTHLFHFHNANKKLYTCGECGETFKYSHRLTYHKRKIHTGFRPHQCDTCGKRFFDLGTMKKHVKLIHLKLREHPCKYCKKDYSSRYALKVHIRQHTDETPYVCEICAEGFRQLVSLKTHMAKHERLSTRKNQVQYKSEEEEDGEEMNEDIFT